MTSRTESPITIAWNAMPPSVRDQAARIAGHNRHMTWPEILLLIGQALTTAPEGWKLVPIEPDEQMIARAREANRGYLDVPSYRAMLDAAPEPALDRDEGTE